MLFIVTQDSATAVSYEIVVALEAYGATVDTVFGTVNSALIAAQQSAALSQDMNDLLKVSKGGDYIAVSVGEVENSESDMVVVYLSTSAPSLAPIDENNSGIDAEEENAMISISVILTAVVAGSILLFCYCSKRTTEYDAPGGERNYKHFELEFPMSDNSTGSDASNVDASNSPLHDKKSNKLSSDVNMLNL